jgi:ribosomal protein S18 acetylase RimI-like enzyme
MAHRHTCEDCGVTVAAAELRAFSDAYLAHAREAHPDWPFPDQAIRNVAEATQRLTGSTERLDSIGPISVEPVTGERIDDWLGFFDHDGFAGNPVDAVCYCTGPHIPGSGMRPWRQNRADMLELLRTGRAFGYLAYAGGQVAGWVNASMRSECARYRLGSDSDLAVIAVTCFVIAPPFRRHGVARALLRRVLADAGERGAGRVEAYPSNRPDPSDAANYRGHPELFLSHGFQVAERREHDTVLRRPA